MCFSKAGHYLNALFVNIVKMALVGVVKRVPVV